MTPGVFLPDLSTAKQCGLCWNFWTRNSLILFRTETRSSLESTTADGWSSSMNSIRPRERVPKPSRDLSCSLCLARKQRTLPTGRLPFRAEVTTLSVVRLRFRERGMTLGLQRLCRVPTTEWPQQRFAIRPIETEPLFGSLGRVVVVQLVSGSQSRPVRRHGVLDEREICLNHYGSDIWN